MKKILGIIAGEPNSISSEIIFKTWKLRKKFNHQHFFIIGSVNLLNKQKKVLNYNIKIREINNCFNVKNFNSNFLPVFNVKFHQNKAFKKISSKSNKYIFNCFAVAINLIKRKKMHGLINCPISKEHLLKNKYNGITEFLSKKFNKRESEVMLIFNNKLSVSPITTHISLESVTKKINKKKILEKIKIINSFYKKKLKKIPCIGVLGLNPHNHSYGKKSVEKTAIIPALKTLKKNNVKVIGPISPDSSFLVYKKYKFDVLVGMYHDQVLTAYKALFGYKAINVTLGLPFLRTSPDHGIAKNIVGRRIANPKSLIEAIKFFNFIKSN